MYKGEPLTNDIDFALRLILKRENVTQYITYTHTKTMFASSILLYKNLSIFHNPEGKIMEYRWFYPLSFRGVFLKLKLKDDRDVWIVFWGDVKYEKNVNLYSIDIRYFNNIN